MKICSPLDRWDINHLNNVGQRHQRVFSLRYKRNIELAQSFRYVFFLYALYAHASKIFWTFFCFFREICWDFKKVFYSTLFHLPPVRFYCVGGCWDWSQALCCVFGIGSQHCGWTVSLFLFLFSGALFPIWKLSSARWEQDPYLVAVGARTEYLFHWGGEEMPWEYTLYRKFVFCTPRNETASPRSQFLHSFTCGRFIYSQDRSANLAATK